MLKIGLIDYGMGNIHSVKKAIENLDQEVVLVNKKEQINRCKALLIPGQGSFDPAMINLTRNCSPRKRGDIKSDWENTYDSLHFLGLPH